MADFRIEITGLRPLLMKNGRLADPMDPATKAFKAANKKPSRSRTDDDLIEIAHLEWLGSLYWDDEVGPYLPGDNALGMLVEAGKLQRQGKDIQRGLIIKHDVNPLSYRGSRTLDELWADENFRLMKGIKQGKNRIMRCRPIFRQWAVNFEGTTDPSIVDFDVLVDIVERAGRMVGLGDWRPRYGLFDAKVIDLSTEVKPASTRTRRKAG